MTSLLAPLLKALAFFTGLSGHGLTLLLGATLKGTAILLLAVVASLVLRRLSAAARHLIWTLALGALLTLPILSLTLPAWNITLTSPVPASTVSKRATATDAFSIAGRSRPGRLGRAQPESQPADPAGANHHSWADGILCLWVAGFLLVAARFLVGEVRMRRLGGRSRPFETSEARFILENLRTSLQISRRVNLQACNEITIPLTWGILQPALLLPADAAGWPPERLRLVLAHELAHVKRRDCLTQTIAHVACVLFWFHPLVWFAASAMRNERECACDDVVLSLDIRATDYAEQLVSFARGLQFRGSWSASMAVTQSFQLEVRMKALLLPVAVIHATASNGTGKISGTVRDPSGAVIPGAEVTANNLGSHDHIVVLSSRDGSFEFLAIPAGHYRLKVIEPGFAYAQSGELELEASGDLRQDVTMQIGPVSQEIVVHGQIPAKAQRTPPPTPRRIRVGGQVEAAKLINHVVPVYPRSAEQQGIEGTVILRAVIGTSGQILSCTPYNDADPNLVKSATDAVRQWRYRPTLLNGDPVEVETTITVFFRLEA